MSTIFSTPLLFLIFNRPHTTQQIFHVIQTIRPKYLYIAADGPRSQRAGEAERCLQARTILQQIDWDCELKVLLREANLGCKKAVSSAINWFFDHVEEGIILEDDCMPHPTFFPFCEMLLEKYRHDNRIMHIGGCNFQDGHKRSDGSYYFSRYSHVWGWASWRRAWSHYDVDMKSFPEFKRQKQIANIWDSTKQQKQCLRLLESIYQGRIDTWDVQWTYAVWAQNGLAIWPEVNLISNIGFGQGATHTKYLDARLSELPVFPLENIRHPLFILPNAEADRYTFRIFALGLAKIWRVLWYMLRKLFSRQ